MRNFKRTIVALGLLALVGMSAGCYSLLEPVPWGPWQEWRPEARVYPPSSPIDTVTVVSTYQLAEGGQVQVEATLEGNEGAGNAVVFAYFHR